MKLLTKLFAVTIVFTSMFSFATPPEQNRQSLQNQMLIDLNFVKSLLEGYYAPAYWKKSQGWDLEAELEKAQGIIKENPNLSVKDYQRILKKFLSTTHDYHVSVSFESTEAATLPFVVKEVQGRYFVVDVNRGRLSQTVYPIEVGDELIAFDEKPVSAVIDKILEEEFSPPYTKTDYALADMMLTFRSGKKGDSVPQGPVMVTFKHFATGKEKSYQIIWDYTPEKIKDINSKKTAGPASPSEKKIASESLKLSDDPFFRKMLSPMLDKLTPTSKMQVNGHSLSARESFVPPLGQVVWRSDPSSHFFAYLFITDENRVVGYVRIPHYKGSVDEAREFNDLIEFMQRETNALVIDQLNNPGGSLFYLYSILSNLTDKPLATPKHRLSLSQKDLSFVNKYIPLFELIENDDDAQAVIGQTFDGLPVTYQVAQFMRNYFRFIVEQWNNGNTLTEPFYVYGFDYINPSPYVNYTKPILVLINEMDFSGGDFFPAILQDNQRAVLFGTKTAGAGGSIDRTSYINLLGIDTVSFTASIVGRIDLTPIEDLGVTPDIQYELTPGDIQDGYQGYVEAVNRAVEAMLNPLE